MLEYYDALTTSLALKARRGDRRHDMAMEDAFYQQFAESPWARLRRRWHNLLRRLRTASSVGLGAKALSAENADGADQCHEPAGGKAEGGGAADQGGVIGDRLGDSSGATVAGRRKRAVHRGHPKLAVQNCLKPAMCRLQVTAQSGRIVAHSNRMTELR